MYLYNQVLKPKNIDLQPNPEELRSMFWKNFCSYFKRAASYLKWDKNLSRGIDCANGVGGKIMPYFNEELKEYQVNS